MSTKKALSILLIGVLSVSTSAVWIRFSNAPSSSLAFIRLLWSVLFLAPLAFFRHKTELFQLKKKDILMCGFSGFFLALHFLFYFEAVKTTSVINATILVSTNVIFTALGSIFFLRKKIPFIAAIAIVCAMTGSVIVSLSSGNSGQSNLMGDLSALIAAAFSSAYMLFGKKQRGHMSTTVYTFCTYSSCLFFLGLYCLLTFSPVWSLGLQDWMCGLMLCLICTLGGHNILSWSYRYFSPGFVANTLLLQPLFAAILGYIFFDEKAIPMQFLGVLFIIFGIYLYTKAETKQISS